MALTTVTATITGGEFFDLAAVNTAMTGISVDITYSGYAVAVEYDVDPPGGPVAISVTHNAGDGVSSGTIIAALQGITFAEEDDDRAVIETEQAEWATVLARLAALEAP